MRISILFVLMAGLCAGSVRADALDDAIKRTKERLKYLAGTELGAGMFAMDVLPEEKAAELQAVQVTLEEQ